MKAKLSAFVDAELSEHEERQVLEQLKSDAELRDAWERYHLIRAAMTHQLDGLAPRGLADRIGARLQTEQRDQRLRFWPLVSGFAAAASVAAIAIVTAQTFVRTPAATATLAETTANGATALVASSGTNATPAPSPGDRLNFYLVGHYEFMPTAGMGGMLPYARVVTHDAD